MTRTFQAKVDGPVLRPVTPIDVPDGTLVDVTVAIPDDGPVGSGEAFLHAIRSIGPIDSGAMEDFEAALRANERRMDLRDPFEPDPKP